MNHSVTFALYALTVAVTFICLLTDLKAKRIYNKVTYSGIAAGIFANGWWVEADPYRGFKGCLFSLGCFGILRALGCLAAGDVKLMAAVGSLLGIPFLLPASFHILCVAALLGLVALIWNGSFLTLLRGAGISALSLLIPGVPVIALPKQRTLIPFAPAIFIGTAFTILQQYFHWSAVI